MPKPDLHIPSVGEHDPDLVCDLRRVRSRDAAQTVLLRAEYLPAEDRRLIELVYREGLPTNRVASMGFGAVRQVRYRIHSIVRRMMEPEFAFVAVHAGAWPPTRRRIARAHFLHGLPLSEVSRRLGLSYYTVRRHHDAIRAVCESDAGRGFNTRRTVEGTP